ncbi:MAG: hypothetical protein GKR89_11820, partial [Candidatus Latescibacteria bacterium]|nr:hypothetical protein [Candidatus Latescibacterota bacterium]
MPYGSFYLQGSFMALGFSTVGAVFLLFFLTGLVNPLLRTLRPRLALRRGEILLVYIMMVMASPLPSLFAAKFLIQVTIPFYYATPENEWQELILPYIPDWLMLADPEGLDAFYEGLGAGQPVPWSFWLPVILSWMPFVWALFLVMIAAMVIVRKQWSEHERLIYPLVQVPLAMTEEGANGQRINPFFKNPVMWAGFAIPALWGTLHGLHNYFPEVLQIARHADMFSMSLPVFNDTPPLHFILRFNILGFFYFLKTEIAFSLWFFNLFAVMLRGLFGFVGITSSEMLGAGHAVHNPILAHHSMGGMLVLVLAGLWTGRSHLRAVWRKAFTGDPEVDDSDEMLSYRAAVLILLAGCLVLIGWLWMAGLPLWAATALLVLALVIFFGFTRVVAEGGLSDGAPPVIPAGILISAVGSSALSPYGLVGLATTFMWTANMRSFVMASCANSLKLGEELAGGKRPLFWAMLLALAVSLGAAVWMLLSVGYEAGALNMRLGGTGTAHRAGFDFIERLLRSPTQAYAWGWFHTGVGAAVMTGLLQKSGEGKMVHNLCDLPFSIRCLLNGPGQRLAQDLFGNG